MKTAYYTFLFAILLSGLSVACSDDNDNEDNSNGGKNGPPADAQLTSTTIATDSKGFKYTIGFDQASSINQNPFLLKEDPDGNRVWRITHESTGVDGRGVWVAIDNNDIPWAVFSVDGGSNSNEYITQKHVEPNAFSSVFANSYGRGGGPKVAILAQINPENGNIAKGTFVTARLTNGRTNTLNIVSIGFNNGHIAFESSSAAWPPGAGEQYVRLPNITDEDRVDGSFKVYYEINTALSSIIEATLLTE